MSRAFLAAFLALLSTVALRADKLDGRKANPFAPSLPQLTDEEEDEIDRVIDQFIAFDTGKLNGAEGKKALAAFNKLGSEAFPGLIRGLNKAAKLSASCPALTIGKKLAGIIRSTFDVELLEFARENIGAGVGRNSHGSLLNDLRVACMIRKRYALANSSLAAKEKQKEKSPKFMSVSELAASATTAKGPRLKLILTELASRKGNEVIGALSSAASSRDLKTVTLARTLLMSNLARLPDKSLKERLKDERIEVRMAAARAIGTKSGTLIGDLIELLTDNSVEVRRAAHQSLVKLSKGSDFGPDQDANDAAWSEAAKAWQRWSVKQKIH